MSITPFVPEYITVHLGVPDDKQAENVRVTFTDYIKNVASSEIYPTWPEAALRANILAQITFALNRVYTEWYPSRGYDFDITNSTAFDQKFIDNRDFFDNIIKIVDEIFNNYVVKQGQINPYFTQYCDGRYTTCEGLSQWGSVSLANQGYVAYQILQYYYGDDINIVYDAPIKPAIASYPGRPLRLGSAGNDVIILKSELNGISVNYPAITKNIPADEIFNLKTETAVREFQGIFNLDIDGVVGKATWYKIKFIFNSVKRLADLYSEGLKFGEIDLKYNSQLQLGDEGTQVSVVQYYLSVIAFFDDFIPSVNIDGKFDDNTRDAVVAFQEQYGLPVTGIVDRDTWNVMTDIFDKTVNNIPDDLLSVKEKIYPGRVLVEGMQGEDILRLQKFINQAAENNSYIPKVNEDGIFGAGTEEAVKAIQKENGLTITGSVGPLTWDTIVNKLQANSDE